MTLPANAVYYGAAAVVLLVVLAWVIGYRSGAVKKQEELAPFTKPEPLSIKEPKAAVRPGSPAISAPWSSAVSPAANAKPPASKVGEAPGAGTAASGGALPGSNPGSGPHPLDVEVSSTVGPTSPNDVLLPQGWSAKDPREVGLNYMFLPVMDRAEAERAVKFLVTNSLDVMAVPLRVDRRAPKGNNPPPADAVYRLVLRRGFTGEEFRDDPPAKQAMQAAVLRLGQVWKRDQRGTTDFSGFSWEKLVEAR